MISIAKKLKELSADEADMAISFYREMSGRRSKAGRPRKSKLAEDGSATPKKRGRPKKIVDAPE